MNKELLKYLELSWQNNQHNERIRNNLFSLFLIVSSGFLFFSETVSKKIFPIDILFYSAISLWVIGVLFLWSYARFVSMINRDNQIIKKINSKLLDKEKDSVESAVSFIYKEYDAKFKKRKVFEYFSVTNSIVVATSFISSMILLIGITKMFLPNTFFSLISFVGSLVIQLAMYQMFKNYSMKPIN